MITREIFIRSLEGLIEPQLWKLYTEVLQNHDWKAIHSDHKPERDRASENMMKIKVLYNIVSALNRARADKLYADYNPDLQGRVRDANDHTDVTL